MTVIQERDLCRVRLRLLDLCKSFFDKEPDAEKLARWRGIFAAFAKAQISPDFDREAGMIAGLLWKRSLDELQHEYCRVLGNRSAERMAITVSFCRKGRNYLDEPVAVSGFMTEAGLVRDRAATAPKDSPVLLLDIMAALVEEEKTENTRRGRALQGRLLTKSLTPLAAQLAVALKNNDADFYLCCCRLLCSYIELEVELVDAGNTVKIAFGTGTLADHRPTPHFGRARQAFAGLFTATAALSGAAITGKTIFKTAADPSNVQPSRSARGRAIIYPVKKAGRREAIPKRGLG